jgi:cobalt-zinc-cadmium efflux system membrane fusion protein
MKIKTMKKYYYLFIVSCAILTACSTKEAVKEVEKTTVVNQVVFNAKQLKSAAIQEGLAVKEMIGLTIFANGTIEVPPQNKTIIAAQFGGFIKSLSVLDGMLVKRGQTLFTIEDPELIQLQQDYLEVIGNLEYLEAELERQKILVNQDAGSLKSLQMAKAQYSAAAAKRSGLSAKLDMAGVNRKQLNAGNLQRTISVTSPFDGVVTKVAVNVGSYALPTDHLLEIIDLKHAHAEVIVFEKDLKQLKIGQKVKLNFTDGNEEVSASVFLIGREIGANRTVKVHCHLDKENTEIAPGSYFKASIFTNPNALFCVPSEAIVELNGKNVVFYSKNGGKDKKIFYPAAVTILANEKHKTAFEFEDENISFTSPIVLKGAYDILSALLMQSEEE